MSSFVNAILYFNTVYVNALHAPLPVLWSLLVLLRSGRGAGHRIAVDARQEKLAPALEQALKQLSAKGVMNELYLRYFPVGFF